MSKSALAHGKIVKSQFRIPTWAKNRHIQTIWPRFIQKRLPLTYGMERLTLPDDDFVDVAWGPKPAEPSYDGHVVGERVASRDDALSRVQWRP